MNPCRRTVRVHYRVKAGERLVLRTERDWDRDLAPDRVSSDGCCAEFDLGSRRPFMYFKACLRTAPTDPGGEEGLVWMPGPNRLVLLDVPVHADVHPYFRSSPDGAFVDPFTVASTELGRDLSIRIYLPPGYAEADTRRFPVIYMQDGKNLFFPEEAFLGHEWQVDETIAKLDGISAMDPVIVVGIHAGDRKAEYTKPGYESYARAIAFEVKPLVDARYRTRPGPADTAVFGSSLGGVVSFFMAWEHPQVFGYAACMSSTFNYRDDLIDRVLSEPKRDVAFYLDSGWPGDNYEVTLAMKAALLSAGFTQAHDLVYLAFPEAEHNEVSWSERLHIPLQLWRNWARARDLAAMLRTT